MTVFAGTLPAPPGALVPGFFCKGFATWRGPYPVAEIPGYEVGAGNPIAREASGQTFALTPSVASQMAAADPAWWEFH